MWLIVLEAAGALAVLVFIVWWTMFSGRRAGELPDEAPPPSADHRDAPQGLAAGDQGVAAGPSRGGSKKLKG